MAIGDSTFMDLRAADVDELDGELAWLGSSYKAEAMLLVDSSGRAARVAFEDLLVHDHDGLLMGRIRDSDQAKVEAEMHAYARRRSLQRPPTSTSQ